jgi:ABC-type polysaccharide/polyol phosphate transport system ATPase subunit
VSHIALSFDRVSKKFRRGELHDSLRDLVPALARRLAGRRAPEGLGKKEFWALDDVSFEVPSGEAFGIIGFNGAGKSTILKLLSGIMNPTRGDITVHGRLSALIEVGAGFHPDLTGRENVYLNGAILGMKRVEIARKFDEIVAFSGLEDFIDTPVKRYSSGMFARLGFSVAAHLEPDVLVIDEVLSVGDIIFQRKGVEKMHAVAKSGATVVFVSHNLKAVAELCQRCLLLDRGRIAALGATPDVIHQYLGLGAERHGGGRQTGVRVSAVTLRGEDGPEVRFRSGSRAWVDVDVTAYEPARSVSVGLSVTDDSQYHIFDTSSQRLGSPAVSLEAGQRARVTFEVGMHFANGTFHFGVAVARHDTREVFDQWPRAATFFVSADTDVRGVVNLNPRVRIEPVSPAQRRDVASAGG